MRHKKILIILCALLFFIAALTSYLNRVIFPHLVKKIAIERLENTLKRKVEIGSIHFNWFRGIVIDKIKVYEKSSSDTVFAQADQLSFGILFFPGFKHSRITIPYINVQSPSVHLIRIADNTWNFSDMYAAPQAVTPTTAAPKSSSLEIAWGGITISEGKFMVDDSSAGHPWKEFFDNINLKLSLSYKGINYHFTADIPAKKGFVGATVYYQPITHHTQANIHLKNIDTASYFSLFNMPDMRLDSGIIEEINLDIDYAPDKTSAQGDVLMKNLDITSQDQSFKGDINIHGLDAQYQNGDMTARGQMALSHVQTMVPGLSAGGSVQAKVNEIEISAQGFTFNGSLDAQNISLNLKDRQLQVDGVNLDNIKIKKDKNGIQSVGSIKTQGLFVQWPNQKLQGDLTFNGVTMRMKDENDITLEGKFQADNFYTSIEDKVLSSQHVLLEDARLNILDQKNFALRAKLSLDDMQLRLGKNLLTASSIKTDKIPFDLNDGIIKASSTLNFSEAKFVLNNHQTITADPRLELSLQLPLQTPQEATYKGSVTLSDGSIHGFTPIESLDNIELDADFQNDELTINALSINVLDTNCRVNGTVKDFKNPFLNIVAEANDLNLAKIKDVAPHLVHQYGLSFDGTTFLKIKFNGLMSNPLAGNILAVASVKNVNVSSTKFHQHVKNITGIVEASPHSLKWRDFTANYLGKKYILTGSMENFKNPKILISIDGPDIKLNADMVKNDDLITINNIAGKYLNAAFNSTGTITLLAGSDPLFDINGNMSLLLEDLIKNLPTQQQKAFQSLNPTGILSMTAELKGSGWDWKHYQIRGSLASPDVRLSTYHMTNLKINIDQDEGKLKNLTFDGNLYNGTVHAVGLLDLYGKGMPYELALNIDNTDLHQLKMDSSLKMDEINGKFFLTSIAHGTLEDFKNSLHATGSLAIRGGFLGEFNLFKGLLSILNDAMRLGQVLITDVEGNFTIADQKINTDNLRLKGPTIVLLAKGWVNFDQLCDLNVTVDLSSGVVPSIAHDVLNTLNIHIYDKIADPKFKKKISVPQVINTLLKNFLQ